MKFSINSLLNGVNRVLNPNFNSWAGAALFVAAVTVPLCALAAYGLKMRNK